MVRARAASPMGVGFPFGAAHRMNFDTPSLKGNCADTLVSRQLPLKTEDIRQTRYLLRYRRW
jgi:hypothetical protein